MTVLPPPKMGVNFLISLIYEWPVGSISSIFVVVSRYRRPKDINTVIPAANSRIATRYLKENLAIQFVIIVTNPFYIFV
jgi:hypothetical protein